MSPNISLNNAPLIPTSQCRSRKGNVNEKSKNKETATTTNVVRAVGPRNVWRVRPTGNRGPVDLLAFVRVRARAFSRVYVCARERDGCATTTDTGGVDDDRSP